MVVSLVEGRPIYLVFLGLEDENGVIVKFGSEKGLSWYMGIGFLNHFLLVFCF